VRQAREFHDATGLTGTIVRSSRQRQRRRGRRHSKRTRHPTRFIGGEKLSDLASSSRLFVEQML
jgi:signal recognition particle GTPase